jgi:hypothetical protein
VLDSGAFYRRCPKNLNFKCHPKFFLERTSPKNDVQLP